MPKVSAEHSTARRRQILDAAQRCFAHEGFHRTNMLDIQREAKLSAGALYVYFRSKDEIIEALAEERHAQERTALHSTHTNTNTASALIQIAESFFGALLQQTEREQRRLGIQVWAEALRNPKIHALVLHGVDEPRKVFIGLLKQARARGEIDPKLDLDATARAMIALFHGFILQQAWEPKLRVAPYLEVIQALSAALFVPKHRPRTLLKSSARATRRAAPRDS